MGGLGAASGARDEQGQHVRSETDLQERLEALVRQYAVIPKTDGLKRIWAHGALCMLDWALGDGAWDEVVQRQAAEIESVEPTE